MFIARAWQRLVGWDDLWGMGRGMAVSGTLVVLVLVVAASLSAGGVL